jgi:streptogramin lyase
VPSTFNTFSLPTLASAPTGIVAGPDGNLWFTEANAGRLAGRSMECPAYNA